MGSIGAIVDALKVITLVLFSGLASIALSKGIGEVATRIRKQLVVN